MATLTTVQKAPILNEDGVHLWTAGYTATSAGTNVATILSQDNHLWIAANQPGTTTITATRVADGATATTDVTVVLPAVPFSITVGAPVAK